MKICSSLIQKTAAWYFCRSYDGMAGLQQKNVFMACNDVGPSGVSLSNASLSKLLDHTSSRQDCLSDRLQSAA